MRVRRLLRVSPALAGLAWVACAEAPEPRPVVAVSVLPLKYVVDRLVDDRVDVEVMIPPGANPGLYEPTPLQIERLGSAMLYVKVGHPNFPFEAAWLDEILAETPDLRLVDASAGAGDRDEDPHVWVAPRQLERIAIRVASALSEILPDEREAIAANLARLRAEIDALDAEIRELLAGKKRREFLVLHPAWGHFARAYGLEQVAIERESKPPDPRQLAELIERARAAKLEAVFAQPQFDPAGAETVAREIGARVEMLDPLAYDWLANLRSVAHRIAEAMPE